MAADGVSRKRKLAGFWLRLSCAGMPDAGVFYLRAYA